MKVHLPNATVGEWEKQIANINAKICQMDNKINTLQSKTAKLVILEKYLDINRIEQEHTDKELSEKGTTWEF